MKTNPSPKIFKLSRLALLGVAIAIALVVQPVFGSAIGNSLVITENSPLFNGLTATYTLANGSTVPVIVGFTFPGSDFWTITIASSSATITADANFAEPENDNLVNHFVSNGSNGTTLFSDTTASGTVQRNGGTFDNFGTDSANGLPINLTFTDNAATAEGHGVPDTGSTLGLLSLALAALLGAIRLRSLRLA